MAGSNVLPWFLFITAAPRLRLLYFLKSAHLPLHPYSAPRLGANMAWVVFFPGLASPRGGKKQLINLEDVTGVLSSQPLSLRIARLPWFPKAESVHRHE